MSPISEAFSNLLKPSPVVFFEYSIIVVPLAGCTGDSYDCGGQLGLGPIHPNQQ
jgi:hypothetical protein